MWRWVCAVVLLLAALAHASEPKRAEEAAASPFVLSSRYGRSAPRLMSPRNDRFFMSSRYGKRGVSAGPARGARGGRCDCRRALGTRSFGRPATGRLLGEI